MSNETKKIVNVTSKMLSMEMDEKNSRAAGAVKINNKDYQYRVNESYDDKVSVTIQSFFNNEELQNLGIEVDHSEIINAFKAKLKVVKAERAAKLKEARIAEYDALPLHKLAKLLPGSVIYPSREDYIKENAFRSNMHISFSETHEGVKQEYGVRYEPVYGSGWSSRVKGHRFNITVDGYYEKEYKKWTTSAEKVMPKLNELRDMIKRRIDAKIETKKEYENTFEKMKATFGSVEQKSDVDYSSKSRYTKVTYLSAKKNKEDKIAGVQFSPDDKGYRINRIYGILTAEQVKAIMNIVKDATPVYSFH